MTTMGDLDPTETGEWIDALGAVRLDRQTRTNVSHIFAIGDVVGLPMLAHKAVLSPTCLR